MLLFKTLTRHYHALMNSLARNPTPDDADSARELVEALARLSHEAQRLETELRLLSEKRQQEAARPPLRLVWPEPVETSKSMDRYES